jgi:PAH dioxygenase small subunit
MKMDQSLHFEVAQWLFAEADLLDRGLFRDWLKLLTADVHYLVPVRVTKLTGQGDGCEASAAHFDDNYFLLEQRVRRLETGFAWAEDPRSRTRHLVTNIQVQSAERDDELAVRSYLLLHRTRGDVAHPEQLVGERLDRLRRVDGTLKLAARTVYLDHSTLPMQNLGVLL